MTIRQKTFWAISSVLIALILLAILVTGLQMILRALRQENRQILESTERAERALNNLLADLGRATSDYAGWDDTYAFVLDRNENYIRSNLILDTLTKNRFGFMMFVGAEEQVVYSLACNLTTGELGPAPPALVDLLRPGHPLLRHATPEHAILGFLDTAAGPYMVASYPILTSLFEGPIRGALIIGRPFDVDEIRQLAELTALNLALRPYPEPRPGIRLEPGEKSRAIAADRNTVAGYRVLTDISGQPRWTLEVRDSREFFRQALRDVSLVFILLLLLGLSAAVVSSVLMDRLVLSRTAQLRDFVNQAGESGNLSARAPVSGNDELTELGNAFNRLLDRQEQTIAQRRNIESELKRQESFLRNVIDSHPGFVSVKDRDGRYLLANQTLAAFYRKTAGELIGLRDIDLNRHPDETAQFIKDDGEVIRQRQPKLIPEEKITDPDGQIYWLSAFKMPLLNPDGTCTSLLEVAIDNTDRKHAEDSLRQSEAKFLKAFQNSPNPMSISHIEDGRFIEVNETFLRMLELARDEAIGKTSLELNLFEDEAQREKMIRVLKEKGRVQNMEIQFTTRRGNRRFGMLSADTIELNNKAYMLAAVNDITDRVSTREEKEKLEAQVQQSQKMESLGVLAGGIAHDFNNLLMAILGNADLALANLPVESAVRGSVTEIIDGARRAAELCRQMLAYSGRSKFIVEPLDLTRVVQEMSHMLAVAISKKAVLRYNFAENLPTVAGDITQLRQVIMNLIINASEALSDRSGVIAVSTGMMEGKVEIANHDYLSEPLKPGAYVYIEVTDTGCGMSGETAKKIFDPFFTTKQSGHGLGLSAVLGIIRGHKGAIAVNSKPGRGTTFKVLLPVSGAPVAHTDATPECTDWKGRGTILVADDEETVRILAKRMLEPCGLKILTAVDGQDAVRLFREHAGEIRCAILDLTMPRMDGIETFKELKSIRQDVNVIISSGYGESDVAERFGAQGMVGFIQKPYTRGPLLAVIKRILETKV